MTCHELRLHLEDLERRDADFSACSEHLVDCAECARFVAARRGLGAGMRAVRESVPQASAALDAAVLANYRRQITIPESRMKRIAAWGPLVLLGSSVTAAALALISVLAFHSSRKPNPAVIAFPSASRSSVTQRVAPIETASAAPPRKPAMTHPAHHEPHVPSAASEGSLSDFHSLMYCDELSCGGAMELIRVQLPSPDAPFVPAASTNGVIYADVLLGPDGIARGIRIVH